MIATAAMATAAIAKTTAITTDISIQRCEQAPDDVTPESRDFSLAGVT